MIEIRNSFRFPYFQEKKFYQTLCGIQIIIIRGLCEWWDGVGVGEEERSNKIKNDSETF